MMKCIVGIVAVAAMLSVGCVGSNNYRNNAKKGPGLVLQVKDVNGNVTEMTDAGMIGGGGANSEELVVTDGVGTLIIPWAKISKIEILEPSTNSTVRVPGNNFVSKAALPAHSGIHITLTLKNGETRKYQLTYEVSITGQIDIGRYRIMMDAVREITNVSPKATR